MNIRIITASAGTGKTTRLAELLEQEVSNADSSVRPEAILATTFTKQAAAELLNRARTRLLQSNHGGKAQTLLTARIGTVNAVCGSLVAEFSFELGLSPELRVLDEKGAELALKRALASIVTVEISDRLQAFSGKFDAKFDWQYEVKRLIEAARANGLDAEGLGESADRSVASLDACLGPIAGTAAALDTELSLAIDHALTVIPAAGVDTTTGTQDYCDFLTNCQRDLGKRRQLRWGDWAKLCTKVPRKKSLAHAGPVQIVAAQHLGHPRLREELHELIRLMFDVAARGLREYQSFKQKQGLLDFVDQEVLALKLLSRSEICEILKDQLDLVLIDEFQDTSPLELAIFLKLAEMARQSVWVGDPKQAIYGFRGTDPALMDAAIESMSSLSSDPDLVVAVVDAVTRRSPVETLSRSYRSRPALVDLTNAIFSRAFSQQQGMAEERVRIEPARAESPKLGPAVSHWPLQTQMGNNQLSQAVAAGARDLLGTGATIWDRSTYSPRTATAGDLAILCRTNDQCLRVSEALGQLGIASVVARVGLRESAEGQVLLAGLRLWVDTRDYLAAATLMRILEHPEDAAAFVEKAASPDGYERLAISPAVQGLNAARESAKDLDVLTTLDVVIDVLELRERCAAWGEQVQRIANLDALRAHASRYCERRRIDGDAPSLVGFLAYFEELATGGFWGQSRRDTIARVGSEDAVTVSTWHGAKGLEWPIVVLFGLESVRDPEAYGVHVLSDRTAIDLSDPLGGRWIHFWPNPYTTGNQNGPVKTAYAQSDVFRHASRQADREALRVLYVGWTRARDRLVLAAQQGKLLGGLLGTMARIDPTLIQDPGVTTRGLVDTTWAGHTFKLQVSPFQPGPPVDVQPKLGDVRVGRPTVEHAPATLTPSSSPPRPARLGEPVRFGPPVRIRQTADLGELGKTVHAFFAADDSQRATNARLEMATGLLERHGVTGALEPADLLEMANRLWRWVSEKFGQASVAYTEWPLGMRVDTGTLVLGNSDLIVENPDIIALIDHKSLRLTAAALKVEVLAGQLGCYADAVALARPGKPLSRWVHLPFDGLVVELLYRIPEVRRGSV